MKTNDSRRKAGEYLATLCSVQPNRRVGSPGNRAATEFFARTIAPWGYALDTTPFACLDYASAGASLTGAGRAYDVLVSPYSLGCDVTAQLYVVSTLPELEACACRGGILLLKGALTAEQLMPKNFVFYNPDEHKHIYALLEEQQPAAIITATSKNSEAVGAQYPFPMIEDGDFDIPSLYCTDVVGEEIAGHAGAPFTLKIDARRIPATACNVLARKNPDAAEKIIVCAHIDAEVNTPGALDNASGVVVLLLLAEMLAEYQGRLGIEILAFNGEDHYSAGGQMDYLRRYGGRLGEALLAINIDDVGYVDGKSAYSFYECPDDVRARAGAAFGQYAGLAEGDPWYQGDHMIFVQNGKAAIALTSDKIHELMRDVTHTPKDTPAVVDSDKLLEVAQALAELVRRW